MATDPGIHPSINFEAAGFDIDERHITYALSSCFYVTNARAVTFGTATYKYLLIRPAYNIEHALPNAREIIFLFAPYENFEARTLGAFSKVAEEFEALRINTHFRIICSKDEKIVRRMQQICVEEPDIPVTLPFRYADLIQGDAKAAIVKGARESYHFRDLFAQRSPLQNDTYFFGRSTLIASIRDRLSRGENSGVFGLRKSGKTSVLLALSRASDADGFRFVILDCQSPTVSAGTWTDALRLIALELRKKVGLSTSASALGSFDTSNAAQSLEKSLNDVFSQSRRMSVVAFDEIEHISPNSGVSRWKDGEMSRYLWQTLRAYQQRYPGRVAFVIAGTNPSITEIRQIGGVDNPLLEYVSGDYLSGLADADLQRMLDVIGGLMGMTFDLSASASLMRSLGGQPFLTRQVCSHIHRNSSISDRPIMVDEKLILKTVSEVDFTPLIDDILGSLRERYPDEYECLEWISQGDLKSAKDFLDADPMFLRHLVGYGIIEVRGGEIRSRLGMVLDQLKSRARLSDVVRSPHERWADMAAKRGELEVSLRSTLRNRLIERGGKIDAFDLLKASLTNVRAKDLESCTYDEVFSASDCRLYWTDLLRCIENDSEYWEGRLMMPFQEVRDAMTLVNTLRKDAHAKRVTDAEFDSVMGAIEKLRENL